MAEQQSLDYGVSINARRTGQDAFQQTAQDLRRVEDAAKGAEHALRGFQGGVNGFTRPPGGGGAGGVGGGTGEILAKALEVGDKVARSYWAGFDRRNAGVKQMLAAPFSMLPQLARTKGGDAVRSFFEGWREAAAGTQDMLGGGLVKNIPLIGQLFERLQGIGLAPLRIFGEGLGKIVDLCGAVVRGVMRIAETIWHVGVAAFERLRAAAGFALKAVGVGILAVTGIVVAGMKQFSEYQEAIRFAGAVTGLYGEQLASAEKQLSAFGKQMARESTFTPIEVAKSFRVLASAGLNVQQVMGSTRGVVALAESTLMDMDAAAKMVTQTLNAFGLQATESTRIANVFAAAMNKSALEPEDLAAALPYASAMASQFGMTIEQTTAALMALANSGIKGSMAGTGLRGVLAELTAQSEKGQAILKKYGISMAEIDPTVVGFSASIERVRRASMSAADMMEVFGRRSGPGMMILVKQGQAGLDAMTRSLIGTNDAFRVQEALLATGAGQWKLLRSTVQIALMEIGEGVAGVKQKGVSGLNELVKGLSESGAFSGIGKGIGALLGGMTSGFENLGPQLQRIGENIAKFFEPERMRGMGEYLRGLGLRVWDVVKVLWHLAVTVLPAVWKYGVATFSDLWRWLQERVPQGIRGLMGFVRALGLTFIGLGETIEGVLRKVALSIGLMLHGMNDVLMLGIVHPIAKVFTYLADLTSRVAAFAAKYHVPGAAKLKVTADVLSDITGLTASLTGGSLKASEKLTAWGMDSSWQEKYREARRDWVGGTRTAEGWMQRGAGWVLNRDPNLPNAQQAQQMREDALRQARSGMRTSGGAGVTPVPSTSPGQAPWGGSWIGPSPAEVEARAATQAAWDGALLGPVRDAFGRLRGRGMGAPAERAAPSATPTVKSPEQEAKERGEQLGDDMLKAAELGMQAKIKDYSEQQARNTLRPGWT